MDTRRNHFRKPARFLVISLFMLFLSTTANAQTTNDKARAEYLKASESYSNGNYKASIEGLKTAISLLGSTNVRIQDLMVKSYFGMKDYRQAKTEAEVYFSLNPPKDAGYDEMLLLSGKIDEQVALMDREQRLKEAELAAWNKATAVGRRESYLQYLVAFPEGIHKSAAKTELEKFAWADASRMNTIEGYKKYTADYPDGAHVRDANAKIEEYNKDQQLRKNPDYYFENAFMNYNFDLVMKLVEYGADVNMKNEYVSEGYFIRETAISKGWVIVDTLKRIGFVKFLLEHGANPNTITEDHNCYEDHFAVERYLDPFLPYTTIEILKLFIKHGLDVNYSQGRLLRDLVHTHNNPNYREKLWNNCRIIEFLLQNNADPNIIFTSDCKTYIQRRTAYQNAKRFNQQDLVELFKRYKK